MAVTTRCLSFAWMWVSQRPQVGKGLLCSAVAVLGLGLFPGCGEDWRIPACEGESPDTCQVREIRVGGLTRSFLVSRAGGIHCDSGGRPLVLVWHGSGGNGASERRSWNETFADLSWESTLANRALVVYPDGLAHIDCGMRTCWDRDPEGRDIQFFDALVAELAISDCIDPEKVFSVGHSRGGRFVEVLACYRSGSHLALASIAAGKKNVKVCGGHPPIWLSHGIDDEIVDFSGGEFNRKAWAERNGCDPDPPNAQLDTCAPLKGCPPKSPVIWCPTSEADWKGHAVPGLADEEIWKFFSNFL